MEKVFKQSIIGIGFLLNVFTVAKGQVPDTVADNTLLRAKKHIEGELTNEIIDFRMKHNPELKESDYLHRVDENGRKSYYSADAVLLKSSSSLPAGTHLVFEVSGWPEKNPIPYHYLFVKKGNRFVIPATSQGLPADTVTYAAYDHYDQYFPDDERFLVYYDPRYTERVVFISGNIAQEKASYLWSESFYTRVPYLRLAQYNAAMPYYLKEEKDTAYLLMKRCEFVPSNFIVKIAKKPPYNYWEIIYYTNQPTITNDKDYNQFYEVRYSRDYSSGDYAATTLSNKPTMRKIDQEERTALEKRYGKSLISFADIYYPPVPKQP